MRPPDENLPAIRASDSERDQIVITLREHCALGRLTMDEFVERMNVALVARTREELATVTQDLPELGTAIEPAPVEAPTRMSKRRRWSVAIMGSTKRSRRWKAEGTTHAIAVMGEVILDLREAQIVGPEIVIRAVAVMGQVTIIAPAGMDVHLGGFALMGENVLGPSKGGRVQGMPSAHITGFSLMGSVRVVEKLPPKQPG